MHMLYCFEHAVGLSVCLYVSMHAWMYVWIYVCMGGCSFRHGPEHERPLRRGIVTQGMLAVLLGGFGFGDVSL